MIQELVCDQKGLLQCSIAVVAGLGVTSLGLVAYRTYQHRQRRKRWNNVGKDVVVLHQFERFKDKCSAPSFSPYPIKLETFLRAAKINYVTDFEEPFGPKGKCPWITLNGEEIADSQLAMDYLADKFSVDFDAHLSASEKAISRSMRVMLEERFFWCFALDRFCFNPSSECLSFFRIGFIPEWAHGFVLKKIRSRLLYEAKAQGIGRHSRENIEKIGMEDIDALSSFLADKPFMMGDQLSRLDFTVFGFLSQMMFASHPNWIYRQALEKRKFTNLVDYLDRMKTIFWPDWDNPKTEMTFANSE